MRSFPLSCFLGAGSGKPGIVFEVSSSGIPGSSRPFEVFGLGKIGFGMIVGMEIGVGTGTFFEE